MAAEGMQFPWRWDGSMISANLEIIREMSDKTYMRDVCEISHPVFQGQYMLTALLVEL